VTADELRAKAAWCDAELAKATDSDVRAYLLKLKADYLAQADAEIEALAERMVGRGGDKGRGGGSSPAP